MHLLSKKNGLVRLWKEHSAEEGAKTRKDHHDPEDPAPPKVTDSNATEKSCQMSVPPAPL
jgi:hypothetical protein